jgi:prephenate dehydratase
LRLAAKKLAPYKKITAAIQGELGAYSQQAVYSFFARENVKEVVPIPTLQRVFSTLCQRRNSPDFAVVPIENSLAGSVGETIDLLISKDVRIVGETSIPIRHCLIIHRNTTLSRIKKVMSHPQALAQCREYLDKNGKNWEQVSVYDTAGSVKMIKEGKLMDTAAIASELAAEIYGMKVVKKGIQDDASNTTRFVVVEDARKQNSLISNEPSGDDKTSAIFATKHEPGCLVKALGVLSSNGINLNRIESRPYRGRPWEYYFYVDFTGHIRQERVRNAVEELKVAVEELKVLGSYQRRV